VLALSVSTAAIGLSAYLLALGIWTYGPSPIWNDSITYLHTALNLWRGEGLALFRYDPTADVVLRFPLSHYPPLVPVIYAFGLSLGLSLPQVPSAVALVSWVLLLVGIGVLATRLGRSPVAGAAAVLVASLTYGLWDIFQWVMSEVVFLPLLVWLMVALIDLPQQQTGRWPRFVIAVFLLALLPLTRYVGLMVLAAVGLWWGWHWWHSRRRFAVLVQEGAILSVAALPMVGWMLYNWFFVEGAVGLHTETSSYDLLDGLTALSYESPQVLLPSIHPIRLYAHVGPAFLLVYLTIAAVAIFLAWCYRPAVQLWRRPPRTPLLVFLVLYLLLYTVAQPFMSFWPIDTRDMTSVLCLTIPWSLGMVAVYLPPRRATLLLVGYVALNGAFAFGPTVYKGMLNGPPEWVSLVPPRIETLANRNLSPESPVFSAGFLGWLMVMPVRTADLANHHPDLLEYVQGLPSNTVFLTNEPLLLVPYVSGPVEHLSRYSRQPGIPAHQAIIPWLKEGRCRSHQPVVIVVFDWDYLSRDAAQTRQAVQQKCPDLPKQVFEHSTVYQLVAEE
jgi:hypothetical protein